MSDDEEGLEDLPEGIAKEIIKPAAEECWKTPKSGDEVTVHYVGTLKSDGSEFDSSRSRGTPFVFVLGRGEVIAGWDKGVATLHKGEVAKFTLAPQFAYGEQGSPPKIPENATLVFEIELISWCSKDDLFGDDGVIKTQVQEGTGWKQPNDGDEVLISLKVVATDGSVVEDRSNFEYVTGSAGLGPLSKACDTALRNMKKSEVTSLKCTKEYCDGSKCPDGVTAELTLHQIFETIDVSFEKNGSIKKKMIMEGEGWDHPKDSSKVSVKVEDATDGEGTAILGFEAKSLDFTAGDGEVCDAIECAISKMKKGEKATLTVSPASLAAEVQVGLGSPTADTVILKIVLTDFEAVQEVFSMSEEGKVEFGTKRKDVGSALFKKGRLHMALTRYTQTADMFNYISNWKEENQKKALELKTTCHLNLAAVYLKLKKHTDAKSACEKVLKEEKVNIKALYRRAQAEKVLKEEKVNIKALYRRAQAEKCLTNYSECIRDCKTVLDVDAQNKEVRALLKEAQALQKEVDNKAKGLFGQMCKALGKGPIPEPGKIKSPFRDVEEEIRIAKETGDAQPAEGDAPTEDAAAAAPAA